MNEEKFWLVWCEKKSVPTYKHTSIGSAQREAERLARANPGCEFHVLEWIGGCVKPSDPVTWSGDLRVPF